MSNEKNVNHAIAAQVWEVEKEVTLDDGTKVRYMKPVPQKKQGFLSSLPTPVKVVGSAGIIGGLAYGVKKLFFK